VEWPQLNNELWTCGLFFNTQRQPNNATVNHDGGDHGGVHCGTIMMRDVSCLGVTINDCKDLRPPVYEENSEEQVCGSRRMWGVREYV